MEAVCFGFRQSYEPITKWGFDVRCEVPGMRISRYKSVILSQKRVDLSFQLSRESLAFQIK